MLIGFKMAILAGVLMMASGGAQTPVPGRAPTTKAVLVPKTHTAYSNLVQFDARESASADGKPLRYNLRQVSGNTVNILHANTARPSLQLAGYGRYEFELTVTDSSGVEAKDRAVVDYNGH